MYYLSLCSHLDPKISFARVFFSLLAFLSYVIYQLNYSCDCYKICFCMWVYLRRYNAGVLGHNISSL